jgi:hypothetical protein
MFNRFMEAMRPSPEDRVIDVGVTPDTSLPESNYFEQLYPYTSNLTATSIEDASLLEDRFPGLTFVQTEGVELPFEDRRFDMAFCSAVIEHVGDYEQQRKFVSELMRISRNVYILTPNRWFPVDFHTMLPLIHWLPTAQHQAALRRLHQDFWAQTDNLNLLSANSLRDLFPSGTDLRISAQRTFGLKSNLIADCRQSR